MAKVRARVTIKDTDRGWKHIKTEIGRLEGLFVQVGVQDDGGSYPNGERVVDVAAYNEFGTSRIPSRPFMRQTFKKREPELIKHIQAERDAIYAKKKTALQSLRVLGTWYQAQIQAEIRSGDFVPNAPLTVYRKTGGTMGQTTPLIDTGRLIQSIRYVIKKRKGAK